MCCTSSVWFVSRFRHPVEGYVTSERIQSSLDDFSILEALANVQQACGPNRAGLYRYVRWGICS
jgi:hypothetical protein